MHERLSSSCLGEIRLHKLCAAPNIREVKAAEPKKTQMTLNQAIPHSSANCSCLHCMCGCKQLHHHSMCLCVLVCVDLLKKNKNKNKNQQTFPTEALSACSCSLLNKAWTLTFGVQLPSQNKAPMDWTFCQKTPANWSASGEKCVNLNTSSIHVPYVCETLQEDLPYNV